MKIAYSHAVPSIAIFDNNFKNVQKPVVTAVVFINQTLQAHTMPDDGKDN